MNQILGFVQIFFIIVIGLYFWNLLKGQQGNKVALEQESRKEMEKLKKLRGISLTMPLTEKTRPAHFTEIVGQENGLKALRAALCGPNPQHIIIYGPPGIGKTAAARLVLDEAKKCADSPFAEDAKFVELDGATARFDERGIADPLIGSVHDPIYQGAGAMGMAGIPQPKQGAVTKAHGGILFIDEIGELHSMQINKLLKVLEDRKVMLESAYYSSEDNHIPSHIHDIFQNGLPADFRLVAATTRMPEEIPPAIRSRCLEIFFRPLLPDEIRIITENAVGKIGLQMDASAVSVVAKYAANGREAVNIVQIAAGFALTEGRKDVTKQDIEWVVYNGQHTPRPETKIPFKPLVGCVNGLAVAGPNLGMLLELEATVHPAEQGQGQIIVTGVVDEEEVGSGGGKKMRRKSLVKGSVENVLTVLKNNLQVEPKNFDIHVNFPGGIPIDGPSAGVAIGTAIYSAITGIPVNNEVAMTGEVSIRGFVKPVGGVVAKVEAARQAGVKKVLIPKDNWQQSFQNGGNFQVIAVENIAEILTLALVKNKGDKKRVSSPGIEDLNSGTFKQYLQEISL
nr:ATP-dependent protease LonB [Dehalobacterium formicoaceticum]